MFLFHKDKIKKAFFAWFDGILLDEIPDEVVAIHFNLYDDGDDKWSVEFVGAGSFDVEDSDWACDEIVTSRDNPFIINKSANWQEIQQLAEKYISSYMNAGEFSDKLKSYAAVGVGFVDGDISIVYTKDSFLA